MYLFVYTQIIDRPPLYLEVASLCIYRSIDSDIVCSLPGSHVQVAPIPGTHTTVSPAAYSTYPSPYGAPVPTGGVPQAVADPYAHTAAVSPPGGTVQVAGTPVGAHTAGYPAGIPGNGLT